MKRFLFLFTICIAFSSCQENVKFNTPGFQAQKDDVFWRANDARAYVSATGKLTIEAFTSYEKVTLNANSKNNGTYIVGTTNANNSATYHSNFNDTIIDYATLAVPGPVNSVALINGGTGYASDCTQQPPNNEYVCTLDHDTTGGTGSGLKVALVANGSGVVTSIIKVTARGNGYVPGDIVTVALGGVNCKVRVLNTQNSNGEIQITNYDNVNFTVTGKFKFSAVNINSNPLTGPLLNFQYGEFYKVPIYPSM
ncbi:DUF6252 family protein [Flavobacterium sp.]|uniref:DUF6252 family protein n=1 Tax=Flavobacterium sp. TaxID=239 RepID=UPI0025F0A987|nr:DUF6252 family protein [Flavobacterium sp.]